MTTLNIPTLDEVLKVAADKLGTVEVPQNNVFANTAFYGKPVNGEGFAWCQAFAWWVQNHWPEAIGTVFPAKTASTVNASDWYKKRGLWSSSPVVGAQPFYNISGLGRISHTGVAVEKVFDDGSFSVVEGNTNSKGSRTGGMVVRQRRKNMGKGGGFGLPAYRGSNLIIEKVPNTTTPNQLVPDGDFGPATKRRLQAFLGVKVDGDFGPGSKKALQKYLGVKDDGVFGPASVRALQTRVGAKVDGDWGSATTRKMQERLNLNML